MSSRVKLHPLSIKHLKKSHPWVVKDTFTAKFPTDETFLEGLNEKARPFCILLHDSDHPHVKARLWSFELNKKLNDLGPRVEMAFKKRKDLELTKHRDSYFLFFGEADALPGLFGIMFKQTIVLQYYASIWSKLESKLIPELVKACKKTFDFSPSVYVQDRNKGQRVSFRHLKGAQHSDIVVNEFGLNYKVKLAHSYDLGLYPDMSAIRKKIFDQSSYKTVLNLFSYTGAYSLLSLSKGAKEVVSVDSAQMAHDWLNENLELNPQLHKENHQSMKKNVKKALEGFIKQKKSFDLIICDPPSFSTDGKKSTPALKSYETLLPLMKKLISDNGKLVIFLNTHKVSWKKFEDKIRPLSRGLKVSAKLNLSEDCPRLKGFPEGDYLKGIIFSKSS